MNIVQTHMSDCILRLAPLLILEWGVLVVPEEALCAGGFSARILVCRDAEVNQENVPYDADYCISSFSVIGRAAAYVADDAVVGWSTVTLTARNPPTTCKQD